ncbi:hypothetical protein ABT301_11905 [Streptomyces sp. NPDC000987]|uniref:Rv1733c family protein n=1 Tax=Streptomyces sp. NPDC000987 TaxID=3154374 RepID=UPI003321E424
MARVSRPRAAGTRWWRLRRNPLRPRSYLVEGWLLIATWILALLAAVASGVGTAGAVERSAGQLRAARHAAAAVLVKDAVRGTSAVDGGSSRAWATVRWTLADGTTRQGITTVDPGSRAGGTTRVWLDRAGNLVSAPATADEARAQGAALGAAAAVIGGSLVLLAGWGVCARIDRCRLRRWDTEWAVVSPQWRGRTG